MTCNCCYCNWEFPETQVICNKIFKAIDRLRRSHWWYLVRVNLPNCCFFINFMDQPSIVYTSTLAYLFHLFPLLFSSISQFVLFNHCDLTFFNLVSNILGENYRTYICFIQFWWNYVIALTFQNCFYCAIIPDRGIDGLCAAICNKTFLIVSHTFTCSNSLIHFPGEFSLLLLNLNEVLFL